MLLMTWKEVINMTICKNEYDEAGHLDSEHMRCKLCDILIFQGYLPRMTKLLS